MQSLWAQETSFKNIKQIIFIPNLFSVTYIQLCWQATLLAHIVYFFQKKTVRIKKWKPNVQKGKTEKNENLIQK